MKFQELTSTQIAAIDRDQTVVMIPIAAVEQHGPHMPTGTDTILCTAVAEAVEAELVQQVLLTPTVWLGASCHHLRFGATLNTQLSGYVSTLCDLARSVLDDKFQRLLFLNGHGGNIDPMRMALRTIQGDYPSSLLVAGCYWSVIDDFIGETLDGDHKFVGHACEFETSMMMHLRPELVADDKLLDAGRLVTDQIDGMFVSRDMRQRTHAGYTGRPDLATADKGQRLFDQSVSRLIALIKNLQQEPLGTIYDDFISRA